MSAVCDHIYVYVQYMRVHVCVSDCGVTVIPVHSPASSSHGQLRGTIPDASSPT